MHTLVQNVHVLTVRILTAKVVQYNIIRMSQLTFVQYNVHDATFRGLVRIITIATAVEIGIHDDKFRDFIIALYL